MSSSHSIRTQRNLIISAYIYRKALEQSTVASISQHVKICSERQSSCAPAEEMRSAHIQLASTARLSGRQSRMKLTRFISAQSEAKYTNTRCCLERGSGLLHVNCLPRPLPSINNSSLPVNIVLPHGTKMSFFRTEGEQASWGRRGEWMRETER